MKKMLVIIFFFNLFCANTDQEILNQIPRFETREEANQWVHDNITWTLREDLDNWQSPEETMRLKTGVCSDMSILLMYIFKEQFGDEPEMLVVRIISRPYGHGIVRSNNIIYDPANGSLYEYEYFYSINYDSTLSISYFKRSD